MAKFILTPGTDNFTGVAGEDNTFEFTPLTLQSTDSLTGASGAFIDVLALTSGGTIAAAQLAGVSGMERLTLAAAANITLTNGLVGSPPGLFQVDGSAGADTIDGSLITNGKGLLVFAGDGDDTLIGGNGDDTLVAHTVANLFTQEHDTLSGGSGNDTLHGEAADTLDGGIGFDVLQAINDFSFNLDLVATGIEYVVSGFGNDIYTATAATTTIEVYGSGGNDQITGGSGNDNLWGGVGDDTLVGNDGDDLLVGDFGADSLSGGAGNDRLYIDSDDTFIDGGADFDAAYIATGTGVTLNMNTTHLEWVTDFANGNDTIDATGVSVNVEIYGAGGTDNLTGGSGNDLIFAGSGNDTVVGGAGDDALVGETGADSLSGGTGNDRLYVDSDDTLIDGGADTDAVFIVGGSGLTLNMATSNVEFVQDTVAGADAISGVGTAMRVFAGGGDDTIGITNSSFTTIDGGGGLDRLALTVASQTFDVTANVSKITGIEVISLDAALNTTLSLTSTDIAQITSANSLYVTGGVDDQLNLGGGNWITISTTHTNPAISGNTFVHYRNTVTNSDLYVTDEIPVTGAIAPNEPPVNTAPASVTANEDTAFDFTGGNTISVADSDSNVSVTLSADHGVLNVTAGPLVSGNGTNTLTIDFASPATVNGILAGLTYKGDLNFNGSETLTIVTSDGALIDTDTVAITVGAANDNPVATADLAYTTAEDTPLVLAVLGNDTDVDGPLPLAVARIDGSAVSVGQDVPVTGGSVHVNADGTLTFTPTANSTTDGAFTYTAKDGSGAESNTVSVAIDVTPANDAPVAASDTLAATQDGAAAIGNLLTNDSDVEDGTPIPGNITAFSVAGVGAGTVGVALALGNGATLTVAANGAVTLTQNNSYDSLGAGDTTQISLTYTVTDSGGASDSSSAVITVTGVNDPIAAPAADLVPVTEDLVTQVSGNVLDSVTDADVGDAHSVTAVVTGATPGVGGVGAPVGGTYGTLTIDVNGNAQYQLNNSLPAVQQLNTGSTPLTDTFTYTVSDGPTFASTTITFEVHGTNDGPVAVTDGFAVNEDAALAGADVLTNDTDIDLGDGKSVVSFTAESQPAMLAGGTITLANGAQLSISSAGVVTLTQNGAYNSLAPGDTANVIFSYTMQDTAGAQSTAGAAIDVNGANDAPVVDLNGVGAGIDRADTALYTSGGTAINVAAAIATVTDVDTNISKITLALTADAGALDGAAEGLYLPTGAAAFLTSMGFTVSGEGTASLEIMSNTAGGVSPAVFEGILETVVYRDTDTTFALNPEDRSIAVTATDGSGLTSTPAALVHVDLAADVTDTGGLDSFVGANRNDTIRGASGNDTMEGRGGDDTIYGGTELGDSGLDTAVFTGDRADYTVTRTGAGVYTVADSVPGRDGTDMVHDVETLHFADVDLALDAPIEVFDSTGNILLATFQANELDQAVDFADGESGANIIELRSSASPFTASVWPVTIDDAVTIKGAGGSAIVNAGTNSGFVVNPSAVNSAGETVRFEQLTIDGNGTTAGTTGIEYNGVYSSALSELGTIEIVDTTVTDFGSNGVYVNGGGTSLSVSIQDSAFSGSGYNSAGSGGSGDILFFEFTGNASLNGVDVTGTNGIADNGIQIAGFQDGVGPANDVLTNIGVISFTDVSVTGDYAKNLVYVQGYNDFTNLSFAGGLSLGDAGSSAAWTALFIDGGPLGGTYTLDGAIDGITDSTLDLTGVTVAGGAYGTSPNFLALGSKQIVANGTLTDDLITGTSAHEAFNGLTGNDTINAGGGNDLILYNAGHGQDTVDGQGDTDTLGLVNFNGTVPSATAATFAVSESAGDLIVQTDGAGPAEVDAAGMESLQAVLGNGGDTVTLTGNIAGAGIATGPGGIIVTGGTGGDTLDASGLTSTSAITFSSLGGANDTVDGAGGAGDALDYSAASAAVTIDLSAGTASGTSVGSDTVANYENATGGAGGDTIRGTAGVNTLTGNGGFDTLTGRGDNDILVGGETGESYTAATGEGDIAGYTGSITRSMIAEDGLGGWTLTSGGEGTDSLSGIEIVDGAEAGRFLLVGNGGFADFAAAYSEAADGDTIVLAGNANYTAGFAIAKSITISGVNYNTPGTGSRTAESVLTGEWSVNAAAPVVIEGVRFLNDATTTGNGIATLTLASSATVQNSVFFSTELGGAPVSASDDRAIKVTATTGAVSILNNLITGDEIGKFGDASWGRGAITWGGGSTLNVQDNRIEYARTAMELTGSNTLLTLDDNIIFHSGSGLSTTGFSGNVTQITDTQFINVDTDWNDRFNSAANNVTWDFGATGNTSDNWLGILAGRGSDTITGTAGKDAILTNQGNDTVHGEENNDSIFVNANTGADVVDGGSESGGRDTLIVSNVTISGSNGNALDPGDFGDPATTTAGSASATPVTFTMTDVADTVTPTDGVNSVRDISITASTGGSTVADEIEDVQFNLGSGGDTVNISGDFTNTSLLPSTIKVNGGALNDTVNATGLTSAHGIVFNGGGGDDTFVSSNAGGNDTFAGGTDGPNGDTADYSAITGGGVNVDLLAQTGGDNGGANVGSDTLTDVENVVGTAQDDIISGDGDANTLTGGGGIDISGYSATASMAATFGVDGSGHWTVTIASVTDTLVGVEKLVFSDKTILLVDHAGANAGGFQTVQTAIDFASGGETILIRGDTIYSESHTTASGPAGIYIDKVGLTLQGTTATGALITDGSTAQRSQSTSTTTAARRPTRSRPTRSTAIS